MRLIDQLKYLTSSPSFRKFPGSVLWRLGIWKLRCFLKISTVISLPLWGIHMYLPPLWRGTTKLIFVFREEIDHEVNVLFHVLKPGGVFVDIGAAIGHYTICAAKIVGNSGKVLSFEASSISFKTLQKNIELNEVQNVYPLHAALADKDGTVCLHYNPDPARNSIGAFENEKEGFEKVPSWTLDSVLAQRSIEKVDLIKIDVEGAEELVFSGATEQLTRWKPMIVFEMNSLGTQRLGLSGDGAWQLLARLGYRFFSFQEMGKFVPVKEPPGPVGNVTNIVAIHEKIPSPGTLSV